MSDIIPDKTCTCCHKTLPATPEYFYKNKTCKGGLSTKCKPCILAQNKKWRDDHPEQWTVINRTNVKEWQKSHPEESRAHRRKSNKVYRERYPDRVREKARISAKVRYHKNKLDCIAGSHNQRAKMRKSRGRIKASDLNMIYDTQKGMCWWCGKQLNGDWRLDHRIALARGGSNEVNNLCAACQDCNSRKSDKMPWEFNGRLL